MKIKRIISTLLRNIPVTKDLLYGKNLYTYYVREHKVDRKAFIKNNIKKFYLQSSCESKAMQIGKLLKKVTICPCEDNMFFYSLDCFKSLKGFYQVLDNYTADYKMIVNSSFEEIKRELKSSNTPFAREELIVIEAMKNYLYRCKNQKDVFTKHEKALLAVETMFYRPAETFFEALQRILFYNQFLWQTNHKHNGFGRLDMILNDLYEKDIAAERITQDDAKKMLKDFFFALHEHYWFKSGMLLGDTGQIIVLGGLNQQNDYEYNSLTSLFIEVSKELQLPDPKVLLRCSNKMPDELLKEALECIATGIGAPFLSNDDFVVPSLITFGYDTHNSYEYCASACWEPLVIGASCDLNNVQSINFATPLVNMLNDNEINNCSSVEEILQVYKIYLQKYISKEIMKWENHSFETDPLLSLVSKTAIERKLDITRGGAIYNNLGFTTVGLSTVVDSIINIQEFVFKNKEYTLEAFNTLRKENFEGNEVMIERMKKHLPGYGCDDAFVIGITKQIIKLAEEEFEKHSTKLGGKFKFGLSSPFYVTEGTRADATFDGRKDGDPFSVHISSNKSIPTTQLLSFAMKLDYTNCKLNGNVVDFFVTPQLLRENMDKYVILLKAGFRGGVYQLQINVVNSETLIEARKNPDKFPNLIVRVWGFSAYFNDLPNEYKDILIRRAMESENAA
ncbi:MAG: hypothetical protein IJ353_02275 [Lachnospiraceae bacterium]|nr:hypothetical protein [Lachnospiraceae bacterium]